MTQPPFSQDQVEEPEFDLTKYYHAVIKRAWLIVLTTAAIMTFVFILNSAEVPLYQATAQLMIGTPQSTSATSVEAKQAFNVGMRQYFDTQIELLKNMKLAKHVIAKLNLSARREFRDPFPEIALTEMIEVEPVEKSSLVDVNVTCPDPELAAEIANTLIDVYVEQNIDDAMRISREFLEIISGKSPETGEQLTEEGKEKLLETLPSVINDGTLRNLKIERMAIEAAILNLSKQYKPKHPKMIAIDTKLEVLNERIRRQTDMVIATVKADLEGKLRVNNIRIIERAQVPQYPEESQKTLNYIKGAVAAIILNIVLIFFLNKIDPSVKTRDDIQQYLRVPFLGSFPHLGKSLLRKHGVDLLKKIDGDMLASTAIREIRTSLTFSTHEKAAAKIITVTSAIPKEGKSFFATYLAYSFARNGVKTLLVDGDLRLPSMYHFFGLKITEGFEELSRGEVSRENAIVKTDQENLSILPASSSQSEPTELFSSPQTNQLMQALSQEYDKIIIDAPPALLIPDALVLSKISDTTILVIRSGMVEFKALVGVKEKFEGIGSTIMGFVLNDVDYKKDAYYNHHYKSYYRSHSKKAASTPSKPEKKK